MYNRNRDDTRQRIVVVVIRSRPSPAARQHQKLYCIYGTTNVTVRNDSVIYEMRI